MMYGKRNFYRPSFRHGTKRNPGQSGLFGAEKVSSKSQAGTSATGGQGGGLTTRKAVEYVVIGGLFAVGGVFAIYGLSKVAPSIVTPSTTGVQTSTKLAQSAYQSLPRPY